MPRRYITMEDNGDGTISITMYLDDEVTHAIAAFNFDDIIKGIIPEDIRDAVENNADRFTIIPDSMEYL